LRVHKANELNITVTKEGYIDYKETLPFEDASHGIELVLLKATKFNLIKEKGVLAIGVSENHLRQYRRDPYYPNLSVDIGIWELISRRIGVRLDIKIYNEGELVNALKNKEVDLILSNEQFLKNSDLSIGISYYDTSQVACIKVENTSVKTIKDLEGKKVGVAKDSLSGFEAVKSISGKPVIYDYSYSPAMLIDLRPFMKRKAPIRIDKPIKDEIDASLFDKFVTKYSGEFTDQYKLIDIKTNHDGFVFAGLPDDKETVEKISGIIEESYKYDKFQLGDIIRGFFWMIMD